MSARFVLERFGVKRFILERRLGLAKLFDYWKRKFDEILIRINKNNNREIEILLIELRLLR